MTWSETAPEASSGPLVRSLAQRVADTLRGLVDTGEDVALVDFPAHGNVGDSAIWLGELECLKSIGVSRVRYACDAETYSKTRLGRRLGRGTILLSGGGNLGDVWEAHQALREKVIEDFPENRIIQLPQSICFRSPAALDRARRVFDAHPRLVLLVRDHASLELARARFTAPSVLCPDAAFCLGPLERRGPAVHDVVWLARTDRESTGGASAVGPGVFRADWLTDERTWQLELVRILRRCLIRHPRKAPGLQSVLPSLYRRAAAERVERGLRLLSSGRVVITDRLHGHILGVLMGMPTVLLDNNYGKVTSFHQAWTSDLPSTAVCRSAAEACERARQIVSAEA